MRKADGPLLPERPEDAATRERFSRMGWGLLISQLAGGGKGLLVRTGGTSSLPMDDTDPGQLRGRFSGFCEDHPHCAGRPGPGAAAYGRLPVGAYLGDGILRRPGG